MAVLMRSRVFAIPAVLAALAVSAPAQNVISAKSGTVNYVQGSVFIDDKAIEMKPGSFPSIKEKSELRTTEGRAEVLLGNGSFLRLGENSALRMVSNALTDPRLEFLGGSMILEWADTDKQAETTILHDNASITITKHGIYRLDGDPAQLRVYDGEARVVRDGQSVTVKKSKLLALSAATQPEKFDPRTGDTLYRWARQRGEYLSIANISAARQAYRSGSVYGSGWMWNPWFGMYTFVPLSGYYDSPWGYRFWSPQTVYYVYVPVSRGTGAGMPGTGTRTGTPVTSSARHTGMPATSAGTSSTVAASPAPTKSSSAPVSQVGLGSGRAGGRGR